MQNKYAKRAAAGVWVLAVVAAGSLAHVDSFTGWAMLALVAAGPSIFLLRWQEGPAQTLSESIHKSLE